MRTLEMLHYFGMLLAILHVFSYTFPVIDIQMEVLLRPQQLYIPLHLYRIGRRGTNISASEQLLRNVAYYSGNASFDMFLQ